MINHIIHTAYFSIFMLFAATSSCLVTAEESKYYLLENTAEEGKVYKSIFRIFKEHMTFYYPAVSTDSEGNEKQSIMSDSMKIMSNKEGVIICEDKYEQNFDLNDKEFKMKMSSKDYEETKSIKVVTIEEAAAALGTPWIVSKATFKKSVHQGDAIRKYLVGPSFGISDHFSITLWDGTRLDVYAPKEKIQSAYVEKDNSDNDRIEWIIQSSP